MPEELDRIFDRFYRSRRARSEDVPGTGLGLSIVKEIVQIHDGEIEVRSEPGTGTEFRIHFPQPDRSVRLNAPDKSRNKPSARKRKCSPPDRLNQIPAISSADVTDTPSSTVTVGEGDDCGDCCGPPLRSPP